MDTITFKRCTIGNDILEGMKQTKQEMIEMGLWTNETTFEQWSEYAGSHIEIREKNDG